MPSKSSDMGSDSEEESYESSSSIDSSSDSSNVDDDSSDSNRGRADLDNTSNTSSTAFAAFEQRLKDKLNASASNTTDNNSNRTAAAASSSMIQLNDDDDGNEDLPMPMGMAEAISYAAEPPSPKQMGNIEQIDDNVGPEPPVAMLEDSINDTGIASKLALRNNPSLGGIEYINEEIGLPRPHSAFDDSIEKKVATSRVGIEMVSEEDGLPQPPGAYEQTDEKKCMKLSGLDIINDNEGPIPPNAYDNSMDKSSMMSTEPPQTVPIVNQQSTSSAQSDRNQGSNNMPLSDKIRRNIQAIYRNRPDGESISGYTQAQMQTSDHSLEDASESNASMDDSNSRVEGEEEQPEVKSFFSRQRIIIAFMINIAILVSICMGIFLTPGNEVTSLDSEETVVSAPPSISSTTYIMPSIPTLITGVSYTFHVEHDPNMLKGDIISEMSSVVQAVFDQYGDKLVIENIISKLLPPLEFGCERFSSGVACTPMSVDVTLSTATSDAFLPFEEFATFNIDSSPIYAISNVSERLIPAILPSSSYTPSLTTLNTNMQSSILSPTTFPSSSNTPSLTSTPTTPSIANDPTDMEVITSITSPTIFNSDVYLNLPGCDDTFNTGYLDTIGSYGLMFDVQSAIKPEDTKGGDELTDAFKNVEIYGMELYMRNLVTAEFEIYIRKNMEGDSAKGTQYPNQVYTSYQATGQTEISSNWELIAEGTVEGQGPDVGSPLPLDSWKKEITLRPGEIVGFYVTVKHAPDLRYRNTTLAEGDVYATNGILNVGVGRSWGEWPLREDGTDGYFEPREFSGGFLYHVHEGLCESTMPSSAPTWSLDSPAPSTSPAPTAEHTHTYRDCFSEWEDLVAGVRDRLVTNERDFVICPGSLLVLDDTSSPVILESDYITVQCGTFTEPAKDCIISGGYSQFNILGSPSGVEIARLTMSGSTGSSIMAFGTSDATLSLRDCEWTNNKGASAILIHDNDALPILRDNFVGPLDIKPLLESSVKGSGMAIEVHDSRFVDNEFEFGAISNVGGTLSVYSSRFSKNSGKGGDIVVTNSGSCNVQSSCFSESSSILPGIIFIQDGSTMGGKMNYGADSNTAGGATADTSCTYVFKEAAGSDCLSPLDNEMDCTGSCMAFTTSSCPLDSDFVGMEPAAAPKADIEIIATRSPTRQPTPSPTVDSDSNSNILVICMIITAGITVLLAVFLCYWRGAFTGAGHKDTCYYSAAVLLVLFFDASIILLVIFLTS